MDLCLSLAELCSGKKEYEGAVKSKKSFILKSYFWQELSVFYEKFDCLKNIWCSHTIAIISQHYRPESGQGRPSYILLVHRVMVGSRGEPISQHPKSWKKNSWKK